MVAKDKRLIGQVCTLDREVGAASWVQKTTVIGEERRMIIPETIPAARPVDARGQRFGNWKGDLRFLKEIADYETLIASAISLQNPTGYLVPICRHFVDDEATLQLLGQWRAANQAVYPTRFKVTDAGTRKWLISQLVEGDDRILFLVFDRYGRPVGHVGLARCEDADGHLELDNIVRGVAGSEGIMSSAVRELVAWADREAKPTSLSLKVFADNGRAIQFYQRLGFETVDEIPLRQVNSPDRVEFIPLESDDPLPADAMMLKMQWQASHGIAPEKWVLTAGPSVSAREVVYTSRAAGVGWNSEWATYLKSFEELTKQYMGVKFAIPTSSGTGALHLAMLAAEIGPGDEVLVPDISWVATASAVAYVGAKPVFVDVCGDSGCIDPAVLSQYLTPATKAIVPVHLYGQPALMRPIMDFAKVHQLRVIEDAAPAIGAKCDGLFAGTIGDFGCFSFQGAKLLVTGEGGMLVTNSEELYQRAMRLWDHGRVPGTFDIEQVGLKYKMSNMQAAFGLAQLERIEHLIDAKRRVHQWYVELLDGVPHLTLLRETPGTSSIHWMNNIVLDDSIALTREQVIAALRASRIDTRPFFPAMSQFPMWRGEQPKNPVAMDLARRAINLPSGVCLTFREVGYVCRTLRSLMNQAS